MKLYYTERNPTIMKTLIYLPALNEAEKISSVLHSLPRTLEGVTDLEILVVDDGSEDNTAELAHQAGAVVISHRQNRGVGSAFQTALDYALRTGVDILVSIDADGQFDPEDIPTLVRPILEGRADLVTGNRFSKGRPAHMAGIKYWGNRLVTRVVNYGAGTNLHDVSTGFRAYGREALYHLNLFGLFTYTHETILDLGNKNLEIAEIPISVRYFPERKSRVAKNLWSYGANAGAIIFRTVLDHHAMRYFGTLAAVSLIIGTACEVFLAGFYLINHAFTPYKFVGFVGLGFAIFGLLVFLIGLVADMLNRLQRNQERTLYEIKRSCHRD